MYSDEDRDPATGQFVKGKKGGPGAPKGSPRKDISRAFIDALQADFHATVTDPETGEERQAGPDAIRRCREERPTDYVKVLAALLPKEFLVRQTSALDDMTDEELAERLAGLEGLIADARRRGIGAGGGNSKRTAH